MADRSSIFIGTGLFIAGSFFLIRGTLTASWDEVIGTVIESEVRPSSQKPEEIASLNIVYEYTVDGKYFTNERISYNLDLSEAMQQHISEVLTGRSRVQINYNPSNPEQAVLLSGFHPSFLRKNLSPTG